MRNFALRGLTPADAPGVAAVIRAAFADQGALTEPPSSALRENAEAVAGKIAAGGGAGLEAAGEWVGAVLWTPQDDALYVGRLAVAPAGRGQGLAARLIAEAEVFARERGFKRLRLHARLALPMNRRLFARLGFTEVERRAHPGYDEPTFVVMEKPIADRPPAVIRADGDSRGERQ
jgi:ribosomal protein S18 acetylase RimI-like enzyme